MELLAYNFHESIDLGPLLKQVYVQSWKDEKATSEQRKRLQNLAQEIMGRELVALTEAGCSKQAQVDFAVWSTPWFSLMSFASSAQSRKATSQTVQGGCLRPTRASNLRKQTEVDVVLSVKSGNGSDSAESRSDSSSLSAPSTSR